METPGKGKEYLESYSNLAYNAAGFAGLYFHGDVLFCMALQALGVASFVYHWHKTKPIYLFDWWAMVFVVNIITGLISPYPESWYFVVAYQVIYGYMILGRFHVFIEVGAAVLPCLVVILMFKTMTTFFVILAIFLIALYIRSKDEDPKQATFHDSYFHSFWHVLTGIGFYLAMYLP